ncbi:DNA/RNA non-specific endonuclease [Desulfogranum mediterraneum]|uniref:DNA/RNA non-specific endonuclease n=1 Tax=Desulfogranum mediterraneum TaxID=160661 RepID=UPI0004112DB5|nr:DNA/RNA non-specific endonuclease [Desulfogranum mediterraneum]
MRPILFFFTLFFICRSYTAAAGHPHAYGGVPSNGSFIERKGYIIQFDPEHKTPRWVAYHVKPSYTHTPPRSKGGWGTFRNDPDLDSEASPADYRDQFKTWRNYAKGHLAPYFIAGGDRDHDGANARDGDPDDAQTVYEIMYMSNMAPQHHYNFNGSGGLWYKLETYVRETLLREQQQEVWVFAGCIFGSGSYDRIGNGVSVPPMFYKLVITEQEQRPKILAFLFPHQIKKHGEIDNYLVSVNLIEAMTGLDFFPEIREPDWESVERISTYENW